MSALEDILAFQVKAQKLPQPEREFRFHPERRWRADFAWPDRKIIAECEGAVWVNGRHTRGSGFTADCEKYNAAALLGYRLFRFHAQSIKSGDAVRTLREALA